ncbi:MAG: FecCD family ABC transporter permease [Myxococcota bacterium]
MNLAWRRWRALARLGPTADPFGTAEWSLALVLVLLAVVVVSSLHGSADLALPEWPAALFSVDHPYHAVLTEVRLPRVVAGSLVGAALAVAGALLQTAVRNPLADPSLLGVTAGAGLGAMIAILFRPEAPGALPLAALGGGLGGAVAVVAAAGLGRGRSGPLRLVLAGVGLQALLFSAVALLTFFFADRAPAFVAFTVGSLSGAGWNDVRTATLLVVPALLGAVALSRSLDVLHLDEDSAAGVGLSVARTRLVVCGLAAALAAGAVCVAGLVGFVGLMVPNALRIALGPSHARLVPLSAVGGASLVVGADWIARTLASPLELPVGALLAVLGGPYLIYLLWTRIP